RHLLQSVSRPLIILAPGGARNSLVESPLRRWPLDSYRLLASELIMRGFGVVITGGPTDDWVSVAFKSLPILDLIGKTSLTDLLSIFAVSDAIITHDSGPLHVASLCGTPTIALFGPTIPMEKVSSNSNLHVLWGGQDLPCRPCYDGKLYAP